MAAPSAAIVANTPGPYPGRGDKMIEPVRVTGGAGGSSFGNTFTYLCQFLSTVLAISPGYSIQSSSLSGLGLTLTIEIQHALGDGDVEDIEIVGYV